MKIIEGMKAIKAKQVKIADLIEKVRANSALLSYETPAYGTVNQQTTQIQEWMQAIEDTLKEIEHIRVQIQATNLATNVTIEIGGNKVTKPIAGWIHWRRDLAKLAENAWHAQTDRNLREGILPGSTPGSQPAGQVTIVRFYDPRTRDEKRALYRDEPHVIDSTLEIVNATTDIIGM